MKSSTETVILETRLKAWLLLALEGDTHAYEQFLSQVARLMRSFLTRSLRKHSPDQIEDLVQDVLFSIHRKKHTYSPLQPVRPWIYAIARYRMIDFYRHEKTKPPFVSIDQDFEAASVAAAEKTSAGTELDLESLMLTLKPAHRELLMLAKVEGVPLADLASRFDMSLSSVKVTLHRILKQLQKKSEDKSED